MYKALVIGCGNIGALYDLNNDQVQTHTKAFHFDPKFSLSIFDINKIVAEKIAYKYHCEVVKDIDEKKLNSFDCVSICTPTNTHYSFLKQSICAGVQLIICEKPVSDKINELNDVKTIYTKGKSKILINYIRRFQPAFIELKKTISTLLKNEALTNINIRYHRGFINNCSHAFDTIEFLTGSEICLTEIKKHNIIFDHFDNDPTMSLQAKWKDTNINVTGLSNVCFSHFEFELYFEYYKIHIKDSGQNIVIYKAKKAEGFLQPLNILDQYTREQCLNNYMKHVIDKAYQLLSNKKQEDNFLQSISLNKKMINYLKN
ncbi:MAG: hypothetical protein A2Y40_01070 [Candidatus Margulisbacteria bacterium GWF2_35_9]|nr:MAG: hypothetical protein A2Y40_01070 [Candidatus Margulisbacteria bacterium GWF2_35_9]